MKLIDKIQPASKKEGCNNHIPSFLSYEKEVKMDAIQAPEWHRY